MGYEIIKSMGINQQVGIAVVRIWKNDGEFWSVINNRMNGMNEHLYGGFRKWGYPNSWMVYNGKSENIMDDLGVPIF